MKKTCPKIIIMSIKSLPPTADHTQLPDCAGANIDTFSYLVGNPTRKRSEAATAHTGER